MQQIKAIKLEVHKPRPREVTQRVRRPLEAILHMELALSLARGVLTALDANIVTPFSVDLAWNGRNAQLTLSGDKRAIVDFLALYPNISVGDAYLILGDRSGPCVFIFVEQCVSEIDTHQGGGK